MQRDLAFLKAGHREVPADRREDNTQRLKPKTEQAKAFFLFLWTNLAEPLAEGEEMPEFDGPQELEGLQVVDNYSRWLLASSGTNGSPLVAAVQVHDNLEQRWLKPTTLEELFEFYKISGGSCGRSTFLDEYEQNWKKVMPIRQIGQHARSSFGNLLD